MVNVTLISNQMSPSGKPEGAASLAGPPLSSGTGASGMGGQPAPVSPVPPTPAMAEVQKAVNRAQEVLGRTTSALKFAVDGDTGTVVVKVVDTETDQVIRQIPSEEMLTIARNMERLQGLLVKREA